MTIGLVGQDQITTFTSPVNGTSPIDANVVRGNDNTCKQAFNLHDADASIHLQSSVSTARPPAGVPGRKWLDTDTYRLYYDDGAAWHELAYIGAGGGTISGPVHITGTLLVDGATTANGGLAVGGIAGVAGSVNKDPVGGLLLRGVTGSTYDLSLTNAAGTVVGGVLAGTANTIWPGVMTVSTQFITPSARIGSPTANPALDTQGVAGGRHIRHISSTGAARFSVLLVGDTDYGLFNDALGSVALKIAAADNALTLPANVFLSAMGGSGGQVSVGAIDSGGAGFRMLRVPN